MGARGLMCRDWPTARVARGFPTSPPPPGDRRPPRPPAHVLVDIRRSQPGPLDEDDGAIAVGEAGPAEGRLKRAQPELAGGVVGGQPGQAAPPPRPRRAGG